MKYDIVIPYKSDGQGGLELRYTLRSIKNITNSTGEVWIVGDREPWFNNITVIKAGKSNASPYKDVELKMLAVINDERIPEDFIYMADDIYVVEPTEVKVLHGGVLVPGVKGYHNRAKKRTKDYLISKGIKEPLNYAIHVPMIINKQKRLQTHHQIRNSLDGVALLASIVYGNTHKIGGEYYEDKKTKSPNLKEGAILSTQYYTSELDKLFPIPSKYEADQIRPTVHMIWLGSPLPPKYRKNIKTYEKFGYKVKLWTKPIKNMTNRKLYEAMKTYAGKADVLRLEILYQEGGIYTDTDSFMRSPLPITKDLICMTSASGYIANETIYATKKHPALKEAIDKMQANVDNLKDCNIWEIAGATYITPIFKKYPHIQLGKSEIGSFRYSPKIIEHQYDGSWSKDIAKSKIRPLREWLDVNKI